MTLTARIAAAICASLVPGGAVVAAVFVDYDPATHDRYLAGGLNPGFIIDESDISGISGHPDFTSNRAHLISPLHVITARHTGEPVARFRKSDGTFASYAVVSGASSPENPNGYVDLTTSLGDGGSVVSDLRLYRLTAPIPAADGIQPMAVFGGHAGALVGQTVFVMGQNNQAGRNIVKGLALTEINPLNQTYAHAFTYDTNNNGGTDGLGADEVRLQSGDSGHAALIRIGDELALLGTHIGVTGSDPDFGGLFTSYSALLSSYVDEIESIVQGDGYELKTLTLVPEPGSAALLVGGFALLVTHRRRL